MNTSIKLVYALIMATVIFSIDAYADSQTRCDLLESTKGLAVVRGSRVLGVGYMLESALTKISAEKKAGRCLTEFSRPCFYTDSLGGRTIGFMKNDDPVLLGLKYGNNENAQLMLDKVMAVGLCSSVVNMDAF